MKQVVIVSISVLLLATLFANSQTRMSRQEYINTYKAIAINEMHRTGIPASITMAQGCLESGNGNSQLARKSNNHFGIKCRNDWKGARVYHNDDKMNECFRKYKTVEESYYDHSKFLIENQRYSKLFNLSKTDYKGWARGLKAAGYATDPNYPRRLIKIIEDEKLYLLDKVTPEQLAQSYSNNSEPQKPANETNTLDKARKAINTTLDKITINPFESRNVEVINGLEVVYARADDTYESIAREFELKLWQIHLFNDLDRNAEKPAVNERVYLQRKRFSAPKEYSTHRVKAGETMHSISQKYGIRLNRLYKLNRMDKSEQAATGQELYLRRKKPLKK